MENVNGKLWKSEEVFSQLAENIQEIFWVCNPELTQMIYISPKYADIWGRSCESLYKEPMSFMEGIHPEDRESVTKALAKWAEVPYDVKYRVIHPDGTLRKIWARGFAVRDKSGKVTRIVGIAEDITELEQMMDALKSEILERKKAEDELKKRLHELEAFHKASVDRELKMVELKKEIDRLKANLGEKS